MKKAFTLIELLVVVLIIGILASIALPTYQKAMDKAEMTGVFETFRVIEQAMIVYHLDTGEWPTTLDQIGIQIPNNSKWKYSLVNATGTESCLWPNGYRTQPRGWASIRADKPGLGTSIGYGAIFYSIRGRSYSTYKPGVFCCTFGSGVGVERWKKFCKASQTPGTAGACYTGTRISVRLDG